VRNVSRSLALIVLVLVLASATPNEQTTGNRVVRNENVGKSSLDAVALLTAAIPQESLATESVSLSLKLKNLGKDLLVLDTFALDTFHLVLKTKDGAAVPATRYLEHLQPPGKKRKRTRVTVISLEPGKEAGVSVPLGRFFDLSLDGEYVVSVKAWFLVNGSSVQIAVDDLPFKIRWAPPDIDITRGK
jgi:hypothetical protein